MVNNYNEAYKDYYDKVRNKVKGKENNRGITNDYIYPSATNVGNYSYRRGSYNTSSNKKKFKYLDGFILRLIITFILFLGIFTLKVLPNKEAKEIYNICKSAINSKIDYSKIETTIESLGIDYDGIKSNIEEKYNEAIKVISDINLDDINEASTL